MPCTYAPRVSLCMCLCVLEISKPVSCDNSRLALWKVGDWLYLGLSNLSLWKFQEIVGETEIISNAKTSQLQPCQPHVRRGTSRGPANGDGNHSTSMAVLNRTDPQYGKLDLPHMHYPPNQGKTKCFAINGTMGFWKPQQRNDPATPLNYSINLCESSTSHVCFPALQGLATCLCQPSST